MAAGSFNWRTLVPFVILDICQARGITLGCVLRENRDACQLVAGAFCKTVTSVDRHCKSASKIAGARSLRSTWQRLAQ